jgi:hypothetical protein
MLSAPRSADVLQPSAHAALGDSGTLELPIVVSAAGADAFQYHELREFPLSVKNGRRRIRPHPLVCNEVVARSSQAICGAEK